MAKLDKKPRLKLPVAQRPYFVEIRKGLALGYRRNSGAGTCVWRVAKGNGKNSAKAFASADDFEVANGITVMTYEQALEKARDLARVGNDPALNSTPITVERAIDAYEADPKARNQSPRSKYNASMIRLHVKDTPIYTKCVAALTQQELANIRNGLVTSGMQPSSADRIGKCLKAALNLAAKHDRRITNVDAWSVGWSMLPNSSVARNIILSEATVGAIVQAACQADRKLGVYFDVLGETGTRESQMLRMRVSDMQINQAKPRLMIPKDRKGKNPKTGHTAVSISPRLAAELRKAATGRGPNDFVLDKIDHPEIAFREIAKRVGGVYPEATPYALRHSSIARMLLKNVSSRIVAATHNTSLVQIEKHYSAFITNVSDDITRAALPDFGLRVAA